LFLELLNTWAPSVIKGNAGELAAFAGSKEVCLQPLPTIERFLCYHRQSQKVSIPLVMGSKTQSDLFASWPAKSVSILIQFMT
jgi:hypothetical protein